MRPWLVIFLVGLAFAVQAPAQTRPSPSPAPSDAPPPAAERTTGSDTYSDGAADPGRIRQRDVAIARMGRTEFVVSLPLAQADAGIAALTGSGASLLRLRDLDSFGVRISVFDLRGLSLTEARARIDAVAAGALVDANHVYRYAQGGAPRIYAPALIGERAQRCRLGSAPRLGMIDGPVDTEHPALRSARIVRQSALLPGQQPGNMRHGTAVAGLLVGVDGGCTFTGFASGATLYAAAAFGRDRRAGGVVADVDRIAAALDWMLAARVQVINMSFAGPRNAVLERLLEQAAARGAVLVAAAGNDGRDGIAFPASAEPVIAVTAVDAALRLYRRANRGDGVELAAPGVDLFVAEGRGGAYVSGTSYAAPIVSALAARHLALGAGSASAVRERLRASARTLGDGPRDPRFGWGLVRTPGC